MVLPPLEGERGIWALLDRWAIEGDQSDGDDDVDVPVGCQSSEITLAAGYTHRDRLFPKIDEQAEDQQDLCN